MPAYGSKTGRRLAAWLLLSSLAGGAAATEDTGTVGPGGYEHNIRISASRTAADGWLACRRENSTSASASTAS